MAKFDTNEMILHSTFNEWRRSRSATVDHKLHCDCGDCGKRRRAGAKLIMPYSGLIDIRDVKLRKEYQVHA